MATPAISALTQQLSCSAYVFNYIVILACTRFVAHRLLQQIVDPEKAWAEADSLLLARLVAYESDYTSTSGLPRATPSHAQSYSGPLSTASITAADNEKPSTVASASDASSATATHATLAGALAEDSASSAFGITDPSGLMRNSYIGLGLLGAVLPLLIVVIGLSVKSTRSNTGYRPLMGSHRRTMPMAETAAEDPFYSTPYDRSGK